MAFTISSVEGKLKLVESLVLPDSGGVAVTSVNSTTLKARNKDGYTGPQDLSGLKFIVHVNVTEASGGNANADVKVQASHDDSTWVDADATLGIGLDTTSTSNTATAMADLSAWSAPYWRFQIFSDGAADTLDDATVELTAIF